MSSSIRVIITTIMLAIACCGCSTDKGRFALIDIDFRDEKQIQASQYESLSHTNVVTQINAAEPKSAFPFSLFFDLLKVVKCRIRLFSLEWIEKPSVKPLNSTNTVNSVKVTK